MNDYEQMARTIDYLNRHYTEQPDLAQLAGIAGLSPHHFQRKFLAWAGVSPKSYVRYLTLNNAKQLLGKGRSIQDTALDAGLSGPGRLHDLCVTLESATPGEIKCGGEGLIIHYKSVITPFGECLIARTVRGICYLSFVDTDNPDSTLHGLRMEWPHARLVPDDAEAGNLAQQIFNYASRAPGTTLRGYVKGTKFQLQVWRALLQIPEGSLVSYAGLAALINNPGAARAVGSALAANPVACLIPCHRVIRASGMIGPYRWGNDRKRMLIAAETARTAHIAPV